MAGNVIGASVYWSSVSSASLVTVTTRSNEASAVASAAAVMSTSKLPSSAVRMIVTDWPGEVPSSSVICVLPVDRVTLTVSLGSRLRPKGSDSVAVVVAPFGSVKLDSLLNG